MKVDTRIRVSTTLTLDKTEEFIGYSTGNKWAFFVNRIVWGGRDWVAISGPAYTTKGERGYINRDGDKLFVDLSEELQEALKLSRSLAIINLVGDDS